MSQTCERLLVARYTANEMAADGIDRIDIDDEPALLRVAEAVTRSGRSAVLVRGSVEVAVLSPVPRRHAVRHEPLLADPDNIWAGYDPQRVAEALKASAGALRGVDVDELLADLKEQRIQDSNGRPAEG